MTSYFHCIALSISDQRTLPRIVSPCGHVRSRQYLPVAPSLLMRACSCGTIHSGDIPQRHRKGVGKNTAQQRSIPDVPSFRGGSYRATLRPPSPSPASPNVPDIEQHVAQWCCRTPMCQVQLLPLPASCSQDSDFPHDSRRCSSTAQKHGSRSTFVFLGIVYRGRFCLA